MKTQLQIILSSLLLFSCSKQENPRLAQGDAFGSTYSIQYYSEEDLSDEIEAILQFFDDRLSTYREATDVSKFNASKTGEKVAPVLIRLWKDCVKYSAKTHFYFDPTVQPLSNLYGFKRDKIHRIPTQQEIDSVLAFVGVNKVSIKNDSLLKKSPYTELSFNAITGYINDSVAAYLKVKKINNYLVEIGGEITASGKKTNGKNWVVGIDIPQPGSQQLFTAVTLNNESLATSGNYRKFHILDNGEKVVHTINPITGQNGVSELLSATVVTPSTAEADATATALMAMGLKKARDYAQRRPELKILLIWSENGIYKSESFNGFSMAQIKESEKN